MQKISFEEANKIAQRSIQESWDIMINLLKERHLEKYAIRLQQPPKIVWKSFRAINNAGVYRSTGRHPKQNFTTDWKWDDSIELNLDFLTSDDAEIFVWETPKHELGHCINYRLNYRVGHDKSFKAIMEAIGGDPNTCHNLALTDKQKAKLHQIVCECGEEFMVSNTIFSRAKKGKYVCNKCGKNLKYGKFTL